MKILVFTFLIAASFAEEAKKSGELGSSTAGSSVDISLIENLIALLSSKNPSSSTLSRNEVPSQKSRFDILAALGAPIRQRSVENSPSQLSDEVPPENLKPSGGPAWNGERTFYTTILTNPNQASEPQSSADSTPAQVPVEYRPIYRPYPVNVPQSIPVQLDTQIPYTKNRQIAIPIKILLEIGLPEPYGQIEEQVPTPAPVVEKEPVSVPQSVDGSQPNEVRRRRTNWYSF